MNTLPHFVSFIMLFLLLGACQPVVGEPVHTPVQITPLQVLPSPMTPTPLPTIPPIATPHVVTATPMSDTPTPVPAHDLQEEQEEEIMILQPGPGSRVTSPVTISGYAGPVHDQTLHIRILDEEGREIVYTFTTIEAEAEMRGPFSEDVSFSVIGDRQGFIQVYTESPRDGGRTHLSSVGIHLSDTGPEEIRISTPYPEKIAIFRPIMGETISGGAALVEGFALASFEQTLIVAILDEDGNVLTMEPITVRAPDLGYHGPFGVMMYYSVSHIQPGRIVVVDPSPVHGDDTHLSSVEVILIP